MPLLTVTWLLSQQFYSNSCLITGELLNCLNTSSSAYQISLFIPCRVLLPKCVSIQAPAAWTSTRSRLEMQNSRPILRPMESAFTLVGCLSLRSFIFSSLGKQLFPPLCQIKEYCLFIRLHLSGLSGFWSMSTIRTPDTEFFFSGLGAAKVRSQWARKKKANTQRVEVSLFRTGLLASIS